ncbi:MAG TPA: hypothetical protein VMB80_02715 [Candidatus Acidoferrum sp.]|nr:hypothetical protein [Candidatus Acidoferrum sp.]
MKAPYKINFARTARILRYEDSQGAIAFGFEYESRDAATGKWTLGLERSTTEAQRIASIQNEQLRKAEQQRVDAAFERTRKHLLSTGYHVKIWPDEYEQK